MRSSRGHVFETLTRDELITLLASRYESGCLVPFIGAGMSMTKLAGWKAFVGNLKKESTKAGMATHHSGNTVHDHTLTDEHLEIQAQRIATTIRNSRTGDDFWKLISEALKGETFETPGVPAQTQALAEIYWPLTVSTNYDHLFYCACRKAFRDNLSPTILGRSAEDCKQVVSALVSPFDRETIWHIQGFLGGFCSECTASAVQDSAHLSRLRDELMIGHSEYRKAANTAVHFRRCFAEVFRSRSFLFMGSRLSEDYFWNLFGEALELCGPSPVPHFALLSKKDKIDARFLAEEMNIAVYLYEDHGELAPLLADLKRAIEGPRVRMTRWQFQLRDGASFEISPHSPLPMPTADSDCAVALVVRACPAGRFDIDCGLLDQREEFRSKFKNSIFPENHHVLSPEHGLFAVRARTKPESENETDMVGAAVRDLLTKVQGHWPVLYLHLPSSGGTVPPVYGFIEAAREFGSWARTHGKPLRIIAHVGTQVLMNLTSRQIALHELLSSELIRFWTVVNSGADTESIRRVLYGKPDTPLKEVLIEVLGDLNAKALEAWSISVCPSPKHSTGHLTTRDLGRTLSDVGVVFGSVLTVVRGRSDSPDLPQRTTDTFSEI